jgi:hypothetical protein
VAWEFSEYSSLLLTPISQAIRTQVLARAIVHVDETPLPTLDGRRTLWAWMGGNQALPTLVVLGVCEVLGDGRFVMQRDGCPAACRPLACRGADRGD